MNDVDRLNRLFNYDEWANLQILNKLEEHPEFDTREEVLRKLGHVLSAQQIWHRRISGKAHDDLDGWPKLSTEDCRSLLSNMSKKWDALLEVHGQKLDETVEYRNTKGEEYESRISDILHHLVIHGQHHRAQIATLLRQSDIQPPPTDFIYYTRK